MGAVLLGDVTAIKENDQVRTTGRIVEVPSGREMLGRVVNPLGIPIDGKGPIKAEGMRPVEFKAPGVISRKPVHEPMQTGILAIDSMIPIGRGQRELIIGDRQTGKTAIAVDTIINQKGQDMICIYVAVGQKASTVAQVVETLDRYGAMEYTIVVSATASDSAPLQYIAPMAGAAIGEFFMYNGEDGKPASAENPGRHVLCIYDDLSKQAVAYRQMSLTLRRPPGREAYPGDVFYLHSRLLERAVKLLGRERRGFAHGAAHHRDAGRRRVGLHPDERHLHHRRPDLPADRPVLPGPAPGSRRGHLGVARRWFRADQGHEAGGWLAAPRPGVLPRGLQAFTQFGSDLDKATQDQLNRGAHMTELLKQGRYNPMPVQEQAVSIYAGGHGYLDDIPVGDVVRFRTELLDFLRASKPEIFEHIVKEQKFTEAIETELNAAIETFKLQFSATA